MFEMNFAPRCDAPRQAVYTKTRTFQHANLSEGMELRNIEETSPTLLADVGCCPTAWLGGPPCGVFAFINGFSDAQNLISCYHCAMNANIFPSRATPRDFGPCPICTRPMLDDGVSTDKHHMVPKSKGGIETTRLHKVCHGFIHSQWSEKELASTLKDPAAILSTAEAQAFLSWVMKKSPGHVARSRRASRKGPRRR